MEIPGFYYDNQTKKYFRIQSGNSGHNRLTKEEMKAKTSLDSIDDYNRSDRTIHLPQTLYKQEINFQTKYNLKEEFIRSHLKSMRREKTLDIEVIDYCGDQMQNISINSLIGSPENNRLFGVFSGDTGSVIYQLSVDDIFSEDFDINSGRVLINAFPKLNRVIDICYTTDGVLSSLVHHFPNPNTINTSFTLNVTNDSPEMNSRQVFEFSEPIFSGTHFRDMNVLGAEKQIYVFKPTASGNIKIIKSSGKTTALKISKDGKLFISGTNKGQLSCFDSKDMDSLSRRSSFKLHDKSIISVECLSDSYGVIASCHNHYLCLTDLRMFNKPVLQYPNHSNNCSKIAFCVDQSVDVLCSSGDDNIVRFWSIRTGKLLHMYCPQLEKGVRNHLPRVESISNVWYCLDNEFKPLLFSLSGNELSVVSTERQFETKTS